MVSKVDLLILGLLMDRPMHGYEISQVITAEEIGEWLSVSLTSIYYALNKLNRGGLIVETVHKSETSPERSVYHLTEQGRASFFELMERTVASPEHPHFDFDLGVYFINRLPREKVTQLLDKRRRVLGDWAASLEISAATERAKSSGSPKLAILDHARAYARTEQEWLDGFAREIGGGSDGPAGPDEPRRRLMTLQGDLRAMHLPDVLKFVASGKLTGTLTLGQQDSEVRLSFRQGLPVYAAVGADATALAEGETAVDAIGRVFGWASGPLAFEQGRLMQEGGVPMNVSVDALILAGTRTVDSWATLQRFVPSVEAVFEKLPGSASEELPLTETERRVAEATDGVQDVRSLAGRLSLSEFETSKVLYTLFAVGVLHTVDQERVRLRRLLRHLAESLHQSVVTLAGGRTADECELALNSRPQGNGVVWLRQGKVVDRCPPNWEVAPLAAAYGHFLSAQAEVVAERLGRNFVQQTVQRLLREAAPELQETASRYGLGPAAQAKHVG